MTGPNPKRRAWADVFRCIFTSIAMLVRHQVRLPDSNLGRLIHFADGSSAEVYRETVVPGRWPKEPCFLAVSFRLRYIRGRGHRLFRMESTLNTPLFVGFPGFIRKLWLANDRAGLYRGLYEWTARTQPRTTPAPYGGCLSSSASRSPSTIACSPGGGATTWSTIRTVLVSRNRPAGTHSGGA